MIFFFLMKTFEIYKLLSVDQSDGTGFVIGILRGCYLVFSDIYLVLKTSTQWSGYLSEAQEVYTYNQPCDLTLPSAQMCCCWTDIGNAMGS